MNQSQTSPPSSPVTGRDLIRILRRHGLLALVTFTVVVSAALVLTSGMKPVYESEARVLLKSPARALPSSVTDFFNRSGGNSLDTQIEILRSRNVLGQVIREAKLKTTPEELEGRFRANATGGGQILVLQVRADSGKEAARTADAFARIFAEYTRQQEEKDSLAATRRLRREQAKAERERNQAQTAVNNFMKETGSSNPIALFERRASQTADVKTNLDGALIALEAQKAQRGQFERQLRTIKPTIFGTSALTQNPVIPEYRKRLSDLQVRRADLLQPGNFTEDSDEVREVDQQITSLRQGIIDAEKKRYFVGDKSEARNPDWAAAQSGFLQSGANIVVSEENIRNNRRLLASLQAEQRTLADRKPRFERLQSNLAAATALYNKIRDSITAINVNLSTAASTVDVLDSARVPDGPVSPKPTLNAIMAVFLGLFLAVGAALLAEYLSATGGEEDHALLLPQIAGVPLLGSLPAALPALEASSDLPVPVRIASARAEDALREIGYNLVRLGHTKGATPVVAFVGTRTDDTAASVAAQMTAILVRDGMRVTLVDADRAHPRLHRVFGAPDAPGLSDVLAGRKKATEALHIGADGNLRFLAAGAPDDLSAPPLTARGLRAVFKDLAAQTDLIVVRGPSVWSVSAVQPLEAATDGLILVASPDAPAGESVARARRLLTNGHRPNILGVVAGEMPDALPAPAGEIEKIV